MSKPKSNPPNDPPAGTGIRNDPDAWAASILLVGAAGSRILTYLEHLDFLVSIREEKFKVMFEFWQTIGWWLAIGAAVAWLINRFSKRDQPHAQRPTWGLVLSCAIVTFVWGALIAVKSSGGVPNVIVASQTNIGQTGPSAYTVGPCAAYVDLSKLVSFKKDYKFALICNANDPQMDPLSDDRLFVSNIYEIVPVSIYMTAAPVREGMQLPSSGNTLALNFYPVLIPREVTKQKITTLGDVMHLGGKIITPAYYQ